MARAGISASILVLVLSRTSLEDLAARAKGTAPAPLTAALALVVLMALLVSVRWRLLARWMGLRLPSRLAARAVFLGLFGGQVLPSAIGTDLLRGWVVAARTGRIPSVAASVVADRLVALFAACLLLFVSYPSLSQLPAPLAGVLAPAAFLASGVVLLVFLLGCTRTLRPVLGIRMRLLEELNAVGGLKLAPGPILAAIAVAVVIHAIAVVAAASTAAAYGVNASLMVWLSIIPLSVIASALPVSINGWGVREAVIVALAAGHGVPQVEALLVSLTLGALNVVASLPGAYLLLKQPRA
ncbi:MAG TPA: lysylphosphatidylglycerol synthase transmembrane domain-containing protein [Burkholderiales bacterium]|nr:lysylphosphatidylglycerol synthase transmembrane domain-containing protein [Burkholderiales bacterium]